MRSTIVAWETSGARLRGAVDQSVVLLGEESFRNRHIEPDGDGDGETQHAKHQGLMRDGPLQPREYCCNARSNQRLVATVHW